MDNTNSILSIIIPCRNEEKFINKCLNSIVEQEYSKDALEVIVVDGGSSDSTRNIVLKYVQEFPFVSILDNPKKITPCALNIGIKHAKGKFIVRMDAHTVYPIDYISKCVEHLEEYRLDNVGGRLITLPKNDTFIGKLIAMSLASVFGVGNSHFRTGVAMPMLTDTVFGGCYPREVFDKIGYFNEDLPSNQDMEFNHRLIKSGGKIMIFPDIVCYYYTRSDLASFLKNNFRNGYWGMYSLKYTDVLPISMRHMIPLVFVVAIIGIAILSYFIPLFRYVFYLFMEAYFVTALPFSIRTSLKENKLALALFLPLIFLILHLSYGIGSFFGFIKVVFSKKFWLKVFTKIA